METERRTAENDAPTYADGIEAGARLAALYDTGEAASAALMVAARMAREVAAQAPTDPAEDDAHRAAPSAQEIQRQSERQWREWFDHEHESGNGWCDWFPSVTPPVVG